MDQYSKTTKLDISEISDIGDDTPKKSRAWMIVSIVFCVIIAFCLWLYIMEIDITPYEKEYKEISFSQITTDNYIISSDNKVNVTLRGTRKDLANVKKSDIVIYIDTDSISGIGSKEVEVKCKLPEGSNVELKNISGSRITVEIKQNENND